MKAFLKLITLLLIIISLSSCESRENDNLIVQYENELSQNVSGYEFVSFEWYKAYTIKDSLKSEIADIRNRVDEAGKEANRLLDRNKYESEDYVRESNIKKAEINLNLMKSLDSIARSEESKLNGLTDAQNDTIFKQAIHTFKGNNEVYKVLVKFDSNGNYIDKGATAKAIEFDNILNMIEKTGMNK